SLALTSGGGLALPLLPRPGVVPHARRDSPRDPPASRRLKRRSQFRWTPDALALGTPQVEHHQQVLLHRNAIRTGGGRGRSNALLRAPSESSGPGEESAAG